MKTTAIYCDCLYLYCRGWCGFAERSHICCRRVWWHSPPVFRRSVQHPHRLLDHRGQYEHATLLRRSHSPEGPPLCHCRVRCHYITLNLSQMCLCCCYYQKINVWLNHLLWYCVYGLSADMMGTRCSAALNVTTLWLTAGKWWLQWQHNAVMQEFVCLEKNEKRNYSDIEALYNDFWMLESVLHCSVEHQIPLPAFLWLFPLFGFKFFAIWDLSPCFLLMREKNTNFMMQWTCVFHVFVLFMQNSVIFDYLWDSLSWVL